MEMANYIMVILKSRINVVWSWGSTNYVALTNGLLWHVEGYLHTGWIKVLYNDATDAFDVYLLNNKKGVVKKIEEVYINDLIDTLDYNVEKDGSFDYDKRVKEQYSFSLY